MGLQLKSFVFAALALAPFGVSASAQDASQQSPEAEAAQEGSIIVTAPREVREAIKDYVATVLRPPRGGRFRGQLSRVIGPVCPQVFGLTEENNRAVENRIRGVALAAELRTAEDDCDANVIVLLTPDAPSLIKRLRSKRSGAFANISIPQRQRLQESEGPVFGWKVISPVPAGATRFRASGGAAAVAATTTVQGGGANSGLSEDRFNATSTAVDSLVKRPTEEAIEFGILMIEHDAAAGLSLKQLADFAAIYSLMNVENNFDPDELNNQTILTLFEDRKRGLEPPEQVTEWDLTILHALYHSPADVSAKLQLSAMLQRVERSLEERRAAIEAAEGSRSEDDG